MTAADGPDASYHLHYYAGQPHGMTLGITMDVDGLRRELQEIAASDDIASHIPRIADLSRRIDCSVRALSNYDASSRKAFNCFEHALRLNEHLRYRTLMALSVLDVLVDFRFIRYLLALGVLKERPVDDLQVEDLVIYFERNEAQHAGRWTGERVISKWGRGLVYDHKLLEVPHYYGVPRFFGGISGSRAKDCFLRYAREERRVGEEYLEDA